MCLRLNGKERSTTPTTLLDNKEIRRKASRGRGDPGNSPGPVRQNSVMYAACKQFNSNTYHNIGYSFAQTAFSQSAKVVENGAPCFPS